LEVSAGRTGPKAAVIENQRRVGDVPLDVRGTGLGGAALALLLTTAACGSAPSDSQFAAGDGFPAGQLLLATGGSGWLYSAAEGKRSLGDVHPFDLSPDGLSVLGARSEQEPTGITRNTELVIIDTTSLKEHPIVLAGDRETLGPAQWSPDGSQIVYRLATSEVDPSEVHPGERWTYAVCVRTLTSPDSRCFDPPGTVYSFDWSPDGENVLVAGPGSEPVSRLNLATGATEAVISPGGDDALRAELEHLGYGEPVQFVLPRWSASGRYIAALVNLTGGTRGIVPAVFTSEGAFVSLGRASGEMLDASAWAPLRDLLAYTQGEAPYGITELYLHDPAAGGDRLLATTDDEGPEIPRIDGVAWSPDGRWIAFSRPKGVGIVNIEEQELARELDASGTVVDWGPEQASTTEDPSPSPSALPSSKESAEESDEYVGFHPASRVENGKIVMPLVFVDGSSGEVVAAPELGIQDMSAAIYTSGGLGGVDRTINFLYGDGDAMMHEGPLEIYEGVDGGTVEVWNPAPKTYGCPNLVYRFGDWFVGVRTCQDELSESEKEDWARLLRGEVAGGGFLVLSATDPLVLTEAGGHLGPELILGMDRANWIELEPGRCNPKDVPDEGDIRTMGDGTLVSFSRIEDGKSGIDYDWFATWCEDGSMHVQVSYAYEDFALAAAEGFRMRNIVLSE
jgi:hypothetical protein